ncbi:lysophospholipid transporter LplT [Dendrosporobacter sp. 1207_IL3150]|uniref:lysophospholipid transporter LplT n=1 Tax=Dendrosporobacter sp. 1207_IL3150 TaxID=3084054 RepID=UPI002FDA3491
MTYSFSPLKALLIAQFLSAFVDNMILFIAQAVITRDGYPGYYLPFVQSTFLAAYIVLSPWVGRFADNKPKARVLIIGNIVKAVGIIMLLFRMDPAFSYAVVGIGAVIYSPAKYGILPLLTRDEKQLLQANSKLESFTIFAILAGAVAGGYMSDLSITMALILCIILYGISIAVNTIIPLDAGNRSIGYSNAIGDFVRDMKRLFADKKCHYSLIGTGSFWMSSAVLRMIIFAWVPLTLGITSGGSISMIIAVTGVGVAVGAMITPFIITLKSYERTILFGFAMGVCILGFLFISNLAVTVIFLLLTGCLGGIYIVPMNTILQEVGHKTVGTGRTIAVQNFIENIFMFIGVGSYTIAAKMGVSVNLSLAAAGIVFLGLVSYLWILLRKR